jgi:hypothetical protein
MPYTYDFHGILSVETTEKLLGTATHRYFLTDESLDPDVRVETDADFDVDTADLQRHDLWFYGADGRDLVYYEDTRVRAYRQGAPRGPEKGDDDHQSEYNRSNHAALSGERFGPP